MYCMEYMEENLHEWLGEELEVLPPYKTAVCLPCHVIQHPLCLC